MGYKNRQIEFNNKLNNLEGWNIYIKYANELNELITNNKTNSRNHILNNVFQINGKFVNSLKVNKLNKKDTKYQRSWNQIINRLNNILNKKVVKYNLLSSYTKQLLYIGLLNKNLF